MNEVYPNPPKSHITTGMIRHLEHMPGGVLKLWLDVSIDGFMHYHLPGQYLQLKIAGAWSAFSIASLPKVDQPIELHIATSNDEKHQELLNFFSNKIPIEVEYPLGDVRLPADVGTLLCFCRGTGFAPAQALVEQSLEHSSREVILVWEGKQAREFYFNEWLTAKLKKYSNFSVSICLPKDEKTHLTQKFAQAGRIADTSQNSMQEWLSAYINTQDAAKPQIFKANDWFYLCASPERVYSLVDSLIEHGVSFNRMASDVFAYAPRP